MHHLGRRRAHADLWRAARDDAPHRGLSARSELGANDRVALLSNNSIEHLLVYFGVLAYGATVCTVHVEMNRNQLDHILAARSPRSCCSRTGSGWMTAPGRRGALPAARIAGTIARGDSFFAAVNRCEPTDAVTDAQPGDNAVILFTSGTSAQPKGVVLSFREFLSNIAPTADGFGMTDADRIYDFRSFNWCSAQTLSALPSRSSAARR